MLLLLLIIQTRFVCLFAIQIDDGSMIWNGQNGNGAICLQESRQPLELSIQCSCAIRVFFCAAPFHRHWHRRRWRPISHREPNLSFSSVKTLYNRCDSLDDNNHHTILVQCYFEWPQDLLHQQQTVYHIRQTTTTGKPVSVASCQQTAAMLIRPLTQFSGAKSHLKIPHSATDCWSATTTTTPTTTFAKACQQQHKIISNLDFQLEMFRNDNLISWNYIIIIMIIINIMSIVIDE